MELTISFDYDIYCFDIFDTILARTVAPEYVKKLWARDIKDFYRTAASCDEVYKIRSRTEAALCAANSQAGDDLEFRLNDLYASMFGELKLDDSVTCPDFVRTAYALELEIEKRVQVPCTDTVDCIKRLKEAGKRIVCISDFYAPREFIKALLTHHQLDGYIDSIYISSEYLMTKRSGKLYDLVFADLGQPLEKILMIGDNRCSDYEIPLSKGFSAFWLDRSEQTAFYENFNQKRKKDVASELYGVYKLTDRASYEDLSFSLYLFIQKLYNRLQTGRIRHVFFLSREGEFLKKLFDLYQERRLSGTELKITTHYLMVSRKSTFIASLRALEEEDFEIIFRQYVNISLFDFLSSLGFEEEEQLVVSRELNVNLYEKQNDLPRNEIFQRLTGNHLFRQLYEQKRTEQKKNFTEYLNSFQVDFSRQPFCIIDVGWKGTIQDNLFLLLEGKQKIVGLYLGLAAPGKEAPLNEKEGLIFSCVDGISKYYDVYSENTSIFEVILGASHGSADHYQKHADKITVITAEKREERELYENVIRPLQNKIEKVFQKIDQCLIDWACDLPKLEYIFADIHARLVFKPVREQMDLFYKIYHFENFGIFEFTRFKTRNRLSVIERIRNIRKLCKEKRSFFASGFWGVISLRDAGLSFLIRIYGSYMYQHYYLHKRDET